MAGILWSATSLPSMPPGSATTADAIKLAQTLKGANATVVTALRQELRVLVNDIFKEAAGTPCVKWERVFNHGPGETPELQWNTNATERVKRIIETIDKTADSDNFLGDARIIIRQEMDLLLGKSGMYCWVSAGSEAYIKFAGLPAECTSMLVNVNLAFCL